MKAVPSRFWFGLAVGIAAACSSDQPIVSEDANVEQRDAGGGADAAQGEADDSGAGEAPVMDAASQNDAAALDAASVRDALASSDGGVDAASADAAVRDAASSDAVVDNPAADVAYAAFNNLFYSVRDGKGYYINNSGSETANAWWTEAELIEMAIDAYDRKPSDANRKLMTELVDGFFAVQGTDWTYNDFNDDISWMVIASTRAHLNTKSANFLAVAKKNWDAMYARAWSSDYGGGLWWKVNIDSKNACVNGPAAIGAYLLYKATGDAGYLSKAKAIYAWERATLFDTKTGAIYDNVSPTGGDKWTFTYNSGTFIGIADYLYQETQDKAYLDDAKLAAGFVKRQLTAADGLINENDISGDGAAFKAIMFRWLAKFVVGNGLEAEYMAWLQGNADRAWANRRAGDDISWNNWKQPTPHRLLDSHGAMATVQILQVVPPSGAQVAWSNSAPQNGRDNLEAEHCDEKRGMTIEGSEAGGEQLGGVNNGAWARYGQVDFGASAPSTLEARVAVANGAGGSIEIHIDRLNGPMIGSVSLTPTGSWTSYADVNAAISAVTGVHDLYLLFRTGGSNTYVGNLNWFKLR